MIERSAREAGLLVPLAKGFSVYDEYTLYREHPYLEKRYLITYNRLFYDEQKNNRKVRFEKAEQFIVSCNKELKRVQRGRSERKQERARKPLRLSNWEIVTPKSGCCIKLNYIFDIDFNNIKCYT